MVKRFAIVGAGVALLAALLTAGGATSSYVKTLWNEAADSISELESTEFMIKRLATQIDDLERPIHAASHEIAIKEAEVEQMQERLGGMDERLAKGKADILRLKDDLGSSDEVFVYVGKSYARSEVEKDLERRFDLYKSQEETAKQLTEIVRARETSLDAAREKLGEMQSQRKQLEVDLEQLHARLETLKAKQAASEIAVDDSALSQAKELREKIEQRLRVGEKMIEAERQIDGEIQLDAPEVEGDIVDQVTKHFDKGGESVAIQLD